MSAPSRRSSRRAQHLVHHVAAHDECRSAPRDLGKQVPKLCSKHGVETDGRLVEHDELGAPERRNGERDAVAMPARHQLPAKVKE